MEIQMAARPREGHDARDSVSELCPGLLWTVVHEPPACGWCAWVNPFTVLPRNFRNARWFVFGRRTRRPSYIWTSLMSAACTTTSSTISTTTSGGLRQVPKRHRELQAALRADRSRPCRSAASIRLSPGTGCADTHQDLDDRQGIEGTRFLRLETGTTGITGSPKSESAPAAGASGSLPE